MRTKSHWYREDRRRSCVLPIRPLAGLEATDDPILIGVNVLADENRLGRQLTCECRGHGLEVEAAACKVEDVWKRPTCQLQKPFGPVHVGWQLLQKALEG